MTTDSDENRAFGRRLARSRKERHLTLDEVAARLTARGMSCTKQAVSAWENGRNLPSAIVLRRLCHVLGCSADSLLWDSPLDAPPGTLVLDGQHAAQLAALEPVQVYHVRRQVELAVEGFHLAAEAASPEKRRRA